MSLRLPSLKYLRGELWISDAAVKIYFWKNIGLCLNQWFLTWGHAPWWGDLMFNLRMSFSGGFIVAGKSVRKEMYMSQRFIMTLEMIVWSVANTSVRITGLNRAFAQRLYLNNILIITQPLFIKVICDTSSTSTKRNIVNVRVHWSAPT